MVDGQPRLLDGLEDVRVRGHVAAWVDLVADGDVADGGVVHDLAEASVRRDGDLLVGGVDEPVGADYRLVKGRRAVYGDVAAREGALSPAQVSSEANTYETRRRERTLTTSATTGLT